CDGPCIEHIVQDLGERKSPGAIRALGEALRNANAFIRVAAVRALAVQESSSVMVFLLRASRDPEASIAKMATRILLRMVERRPGVLAEIRPNTAEGVIDLMDDQWCMELLSDSFPEPIRIMAARRLGSIGGEEATVALVSVLEC